MFIQKTLQELIDDAILAASSQPGPITDFLQGSVSYTLIRAFMTTLARGYVDLDEALVASFINTASGDYLTRHAESFGLTRNLGGLSTGSVIASPKVGAAPTFIPAGTLTLVEGTKIYKNTTNINLVLPYTIIPIQAMQIGNAYDLPAGTSLLDQSGLLNATWTFVVGSAFDINNNPTGFLTGGADAETDAQLRTRFVDFINSLSRGTERAVRTAISGVTGVQSYILREFDPAVGWFTVYVDDGTDTTDPVLLANVKVALDQTKALGIGYRVIGMAKLFIDMSIVLTVDGSLAAQPIIDTVKQQIRTYLNTYSFGDKLTLAQVIAWCKSVVGVIDVQIQTPTFPVDPGPATALRPGVLDITAVI